MTLPAVIVKALLPVAAKYIAEQGPDIVNKLTHNPEEFKKHCAVCGKRIKGGAKFAASERFICCRCGHRTHKHCAADVSEQICKRCAGS
jgi:hypothetical protein